LMEGTPGHIDLDKLHAALLAVPGVANVHDVHVWTITSGFDAIAAHVQVSGAEKAEGVLAEVTRVVRDDFGIQHTTIQIEHPTFSD
jgi:cobalt-zinc-cadmium efflux system protein